MKQIFEQFVQFVQQGVAWIIRFVQLIWTWAAEQISRIAQVPWGGWPLWKQILLIIVIAAVAYLLFIAARQLWVAGIRVLRAFGSLLIAFVVTLPTILVAGVVALAGLWALNNVNLSSLPTLTILERSNPPPSGETTGQR